MKKFILIVFMACGCLHGLWAQAPQGFNYQAVARDADGNVITGQIQVRFTLHEDGATGFATYSETHQIETNDQGVFNLSMGNGTPQSGSMAAVDWAHHQYYLQVELKTNGSGSYTDMGSTPLLSVPYAMYAAQSGSTMTAGNGIQIQNNVVTNTGDLSNTNELQSLTLNGNQLSISDGNTVILPTGTTYVEGAGIDITGTTISAIDASPTNEIQMLSLNGNQLSLSNGGGSVQLPAGNTSWAINGSTIYNTPTSNDVGIGTDASSTAKLNVVATGSKHAGNFTSPGTGDALHAYANGTGAGISASSLNGPGGVFTTQNGTAGYFSSNTGLGLIVEKGKVGIGTTNPGANLEINQGYFRIFGPEDGVGSLVTVYGHNNERIFYGLSYDEGDVALFSANGGYGLVLEDDSGGGLGTGLKFGATTNWNQYLDAAKDMNFANNNTLRAWISDTDGSYHNSSDRRLKKDIQPMQNVLDGICSLQAYTYHMKDAEADAPLSLGLMAQDVEAVFPQLVEEKEGYKSLCYDHFAVLSIEAIKEQQEEIKGLQQKVQKTDTLSINIEDLQALARNQQERIEILEQQNANLQRDLAEIKKKLGI